MGFIVQVNGLDFGRRVVYLGKVEYMGTDTDSLGQFHDGRKNKLFSDCFRFSVESSA